VSSPRVLWHHFGMVNLFIRNNVLDLSYKHAATRPSTPDAPLLSVYLMLGVKTSVNMA